LSRIIFKITTKIVKLNLRILVLIIIIRFSKFIRIAVRIDVFSQKTPKISKAPDGQGPLLTNYKPKL